jgi:hypothetical protein
MANATLPILIPLDQIVANPWRDEVLYPIVEDHVGELRDSIDEHGFASIKGRHVNGKVEIACGHARIVAARKAGLDTVPIVIDDDLDDGEMLRLMTAENATQKGSSPGAIVNEVAAVIRRLIHGLLTSSGFPEDVARAFESKLAIDTAQTKLRGRQADPNANLPNLLGVPVIQRYLGQGDPKKSPRSETQLREAMSVLKLSNRYDDIVDDALRKNPLPVLDAKPSNSKAAAKTESVKPRRFSRILDERCVHLFENEHQFHAFREAVTTATAQKIIPVERQYPIAQSIIEQKNRDEKDKFSKKHTGAPYIKMMVQAAIQDHMKKQRAINKEEREAYFAEQLEAEIDNKVSKVNSSLRSLVGDIIELEKLADKYPCHPKIGGVGQRLDTLVNSIKQFGKKIDDSALRSWNKKEPTT